MYGRFSALYFTYSVCLKKSMPLFPVSFILVSDIIKSVLQRSQHLLRLPLQSLPDAAAWCGYLLLQKSPEHLQHSLLLQKYILLHPLSPVPEPALYSERFQQQQRLPPEKSAALPLSFLFWIFSAVTLFSPSMTRGTVSHMISTFSQANSFS